jgi:hypothetical protein
MRTVAAVLILLLLGLHGRADVTIVQKTEGRTHSGQVILQIKGNKARVDVAPRVTMITDLVTGDTVSLNHHSRIFFRVLGAEAAKLRLMAIGFQAGAELPKLTPTGKKEKVDNRDCEVFTWRVGDLQVTDWIDPAYPDWKTLLAELHRFQSAGLASSAAALMPPLDQFPGMVIKREMNLRGTKTTSILISVNHEPIDAQLLEIPKGYAEQPAPKMPEK